MGYYIQQDDTSFFIAAADIPSVTNALKCLMAQVDAKGSGRSSRGGKQVAHFAWVDTKRVTQYLEAGDLEAALYEWRWELEFDPDGNIEGIMFRGEKSGDDLELWNSIAPWVREGSFIGMIGEDGYHWRWFFSDGGCKEQAATISWA